MWLIYVTWRDFSEANMCVIFVAILRDRTPSKVLHEQMRGIPVFETEERLAGCNAFR